MSGDENGKKYADKMKAWLMIQVTGQSSINVINKKKLTREVDGYLDTLLGEKTDEEMREFAGFFINSCLNSRSYNTTFFGTIPMSDEGGAKRLAQDIDDVTRKIPAKLELDEKSLPLRNVMFDVYRQRLEFGNRILEELGIN